MADLGASQVTAGMCGPSRLLLVGLAIGLPVASVTGSDVAGLLAALVGVALLAVVQRRRGPATGCAVVAPARRRSS